MYNKRNKNGNIFVAFLEKKKDSRKIGKFQQLQKAFKIILDLESESVVCVCARVCALNHLPFNFVFLSLFSASLFFSYFAFIFFFTRNVCFLKVA